MSTTDAAKLDRAHVWHPFTQMRDWNAPGHEPIVLVEGDGAVLRDDRGREYLDGNSSIWTNLHGHRHPRIDAAIRAQLDRLAHSSFLGLTNDVAPPLAAELVEAAGLPEHKAFFSDDGSTAMEAALKMVFQARAQRGETERTQFVSLGQAYHGDTVGAMSAGHSALFHRVYRPLLFETREVLSPACYRCPYNRAKPERGRDARATRVCDWECVRVELDRALDERSTSAFVLEPRVQGAAGMSMHPPGYLEQAAALCRERGIWLVLDEVLTGFGRTGTMFAFQHDDGVRPDLVALAKGLTAGYLPVAATLAAPEIFDAFLGDFSELKTFFHGHSYTGNALGCAAARANLRVFREEKTLEKNASLRDVLAAEISRFWEHPNVGDVRQEGLIGAVELVADIATRAAFPFTERVGHRVCEAARRHGLLTRPVGDVLVLMPPYCTTPTQLRRMVEALWLALVEVLPVRSPA